VALNPQVDAMGTRLLLSLHHVTVRSADLERSEAFYCQLLGLQAGPRPAFAMPGRWFYLGAQALVHVLPRQPGSLAPTGPAIDHFALAAQGLADVERRWRAASWPYELRAPDITGQWQLFTHDPDGAQVELYFDGHEESWGGEAGCA